MYTLCNVNILPLIQVLRRRRGRICKRTVENCQTNTTNKTLHSEAGNLGRHLNILKIYRDAGNEITITLLHSFQLSQQLVTYLGQSFIDSWFSIQTIRIVKFHQISEFEHKYKKTQTCRDQVPWLNQVFYLLRQHGLNNVNW